MPAAATTATANWTPNTTATYTVNYWQQKVTDSKNAADSAKTYDFASSTQRTGTVGASVSPATADKSMGYTGFTYNSANSVSVTVAADGSTVLNVYYDRNLLTINFYIKNNNRWSISQTFTGLYGSSLTSNGYTWPTNKAWNSKADGNGTTLTYLDDSF